MPDGSLRVADLKTGKYAASVADAEVNPQLGVYQLAVQEGAFAGEQAVSAGAELVYVGTPTKAAALQVALSLSATVPPAVAAPAMAPRAALQRLWGQ